MDEVSPTREENDILTNLDYTTTRYTWSLDRSVLIVDEVETIGEVNRETISSTGTFVVATRMFSVKDAQTVASLGSFALAEDTSAGVRVSAERETYSYHALQLALRALTLQMDPLPSAAFKFALAKANVEDYEKRFTFAEGDHVAKTVLSAAHLVKGCPLHLGFTYVIDLEDGTGLIKQASLVQCDLLNETYIPYDIKTDSPLANNPPWSVYSNIGTNLHYNWEDITVPALATSEYLIQAKSR
mgnify:CR=1 FL=1